MPESHKKLCAITGASRGLGAALTDHFLGKGYQVAGCSRGAAGTDHPDYHHTSLDLRDSKQVKKWARDLKKSHGGVDVLICNAGLARSAMFLSITPDDVYRDFIDTNMSGVFYTLREFSRIMLTQKSGRIITISSTMAALHQEGTACYSATKAAITEMTKVLAREIAPQGVTCNVIAPAMMDTDASAELSKASNWKENMLALQTFPRVIEMEEICHAADFFVSDLAASISGQVVYLGLVD